MFSRIATALSADLAIDLGTACTRIFVRGRGIVVNEPSVVAVKRPDDVVIAVGHEAKMMLGRTPPDIDVVRPLRHGVIANFDVAQEMLVSFMKRARTGGFLRPRVAIGVPCGSTEVERRAVRESVMHAGAREIDLVDAPIAAALGAGLPIHEPGGAVVVDVGGGTTEIAVMSIAGIIYSKAVRVGGDQMNDAIVQHVRKRSNVLLGELRAEALKIELGSAAGSFGDARKTEVKGSDLIAGVPTTVTVDAQEICGALDEAVTTILFAVRDTLEHTPPELAADLVDRGIVLTGGGAQLHGLDVRLRQEICLPVTVADQPELCVVLGLARALDEPTRAAAA